jgi:hypothetical protein
VKRIIILAALAALVVPASASARSASYGVAIRAAIVNPDRSVTIIWSFENANVYNAWVAVDGSTVRGGSDRATAFRTAPLSAGWHTIAIEAHEIFEAYSPLGQGCEASGGHWVCARIWHSSTSLIVQDGTQPRCAVPSLIGLPLKIAKARIKVAGCSLDSVKYVQSKRPAGTVLSQFRRGAAISLVVSRR